ncbi:MAG: class A beta-lactamase-related serine hydrolase [Candidatus Eremiobacteraeota bacterium]|nr:class A beta-lactamase-related serine hydrolase [Candidatus Eremiobacteraeota bacterium]
MNRNSFIAGTTAAALAPLAPHVGHAAELNDALLHSIARIPGTVGVYARTMAPGPAVFAYNAHESFPAASTIKMLIMLTAFRAEDRTPGAMQRTVRIHGSDLVGGSPFLAMARRRTFTVGQLIGPMIQLSDNSASNALITHFGFEAINANAHRAGLLRTHLKRHFLDYSAIVLHHENVTTAADMAMLLYQLERGSRESLDTVASATACRRMIKIMLGQTDRDKIPAGLPRGVPVANKTGEIDGVRNDVAIVDPLGDSPFVLTVLTKNLSDYSRALAGINRISGAVYARVANTNA